MTNPMHTPKIAMMKTRKAVGWLLAVLLLSTNGCIVTYRLEQPAVMEPQRPPRKDLALQYSVLAPPPQGVSHNVLVSLAPGSYPLVATGWGSDELERVLASNDVFAQTIRLPDPPDQGLYCSVLVWAHHSALGYFFFGPAEPGGLASMANFPPLLPIPLAILFQGSTAFLPWWSSGAGYTVEYILYIDGKRERSYSYDITKQGIGWIGLLPVAWINLFTHDAKDAFRATAYQFVLDAERDGYLKATLPISQ